MSADRRLDRIFRQDLDRLPVPDERLWIPQNVTRPSWFVIPALITAIAAGLVGAMVIGSQHAAEPSVATSPSETVRVAITRQQVVAQFSRVTAEVPNLTRVEAKLVTRGEFEHAQPNGGSVGVDQGAWIWAVAVAGRIIPQFGHGEGFPSAVYQVDAQSGAIVGLSAGREAWPSYFATLPDHGEP
jgi:hypothetical protein